MKHVILMLAMATMFSGSFAKASSCNSSSDPGPLAYAFAFTTTTTLPPVTTTTIITCMVVDNAEVNRIMIQREATLLNEENKIFVPSVLGAYAEQKGLDVREAAQDVLVNGVR